MSITLAEMEVAARDMQVAAEQVRRIEKQSNLCNWLQLLVVISSDCCSDCWYMSVYRHRKQGHAGGRRAGAASWLQCACCAGV
jgi:hypothetical protein